MDKLASMGCVGAALLLGVQAPVSAMYEELDSPPVPFAKDSPADARARVNAALTRPDGKLLGGGYLNRWTSLRYRGGDARGLNRFLGDLAKCSGSPPT